MLSYSKFNFFDKINFVIKKYTTLIIINNAMEYSSKYCNCNPSPVPMKLIFSAYLTIEEPKIVANTKLID